MHLSKAHFCYSFSAVGLFLYMTDVHTLVAQCPRIPYQQELLTLSEQSLGLLVFLTFTVALLVKVRITCTNVYLLLCSTGYLVKPGMNLLLRPCLPNTCCVQSSARPQTVVEFNCTSLDWTFVVLVWDPMLTLLAQCHFVVWKLPLTVGSRLTFQCHRPICSGV